MTKEWKTRQEIYHRLNTDFKDDLNKVDIVFKDNVKENALLHFFQKIDEWVYPSKSFVVAFCYAYWLSQDFNEDIKDLLNDPDLLYGNDPYFKPYNQDPEVYDFLFDNIKMPIPMKGMVPDIREYYEEEFLINQ